MARTLVTGGAGFIGSALARELLARGETVRVLDDLSTGRAENLATLESRIELVRGDLTDPATAARAVEGCDHVLHLGAIPSVPRSVEDPHGTSRVNAEGTRVMLEAARRARVRRFVYAASSSAYGLNPLPWTETMPPDPQSPYAAAKLCGEMFCRAWHAAFGMETVAVRYFNVFGPRQDPTSPYSAVIAKFIGCYQRGEPPPVYGDGRQSRDFCYVDNAVQATLLARDVPAAAGGLFNVACGERTNLIELCDALAGVFGRRLEPRFLPPRAGDIRHSQADLTRSSAVLGYRPSVRFPEGLARTVEWYRAAGGAP